MVYLAKDDEFLTVSCLLSFLQSPVGCNVVDGSACSSSLALVDVRWDVQFQAMLDIARVTFLLMVLSLGAVLFIRDADSLVLQPIERMVHKVKLMSENPLSSKSFTIESQKNDRSKQLETRILERSIGKVCQLLSVGFGEAGAEIIANNIKSGGDINPMLPGKRVEAIFGFCDIRNFTAATEVFQEDIMEFVNCIASIVHAEVSFHGGAANKNIGDAFLVVWKLPEPEKIEKFKRPRGRIIEAKSALMWGSESHADIGQGSSSISRHYADAAFAAMIIIQQSLERSTKLKDFCNREDIQARMPGFSVKLGFGLHVGWAIEGAIGSHHKIDPSYLSPHVNMASRLEAATKQYGVPILLSDSFFALLSPQAQQKCRPIDTVMVKGSAVPTTLFTVKANFGTQMPKLDNKNGDTLNARSSFKVESNAVEVEGGHVSFSDYPYLEEFDEHPDLLSLDWMISDDEKRLLSQFHDAYECYIDGEWKRAMSLLEPFRHHDGPSRSLFEFMHSHGGAPPTSWNGCRELTEK
jgi:class 3 adenylate cyclase